MKPAIMVTPQGEVVDVDDKDIGAAEQSGLEHAMEMVDKDGNNQIVQARYLRDAQNAGMVPKQVKDIREKSKTELDPGGLESAARGFANSATMGFADEIAGAGEAGKRLLQGKVGSWDDAVGAYQSGRDVYRNVDDAAWANNKAAYLAGGAAPMLASGLAAGTSAGLTAANAAKSGALQGAIGALGGGTDAEGQADLTKGEVNKALLQTGIGAAGGGLIGGAVAKATPAIGKWLQDFSAKRATKAVADQSMKAQRLIDRLPNSTIEETGILDPTVAKLSREFDTSGKAFGQDLLDTGIVSAGKGTKGMLEAAQEVENRAGKQIGKLYQAFDAANQGKTNLADTTLTNVVNEIDKRVMEPLNELPGGSLTADKLRPYVDRLKKYLSDVQNQGKEISFDTLQSLRRDLDDIAFSELGRDTVVQKQLQKMRSIFKDTILNDAEEISKHVDPTLVNQLRQANREFSVATTAKNVLQDKLQREAKNRSISPTDYIAGLAGLIGGMSHGNLPMAALGAGALTGANKLARARGNQFIAGVGTNVADKIKNNPELLNYLANRAGVSVEELLRGK